MGDGASSYKTIEGRAIAEVVEKKSRFIGHIAHVETEEEALAFLDEVRGEHRMARHNVYAYVLREGGAGSLGRVRYSDDGEPAKTAGLPTLEAVQHAGLTDVAVVVTRYFGGVVVSRCVDIVFEVPYALYEQTVRIAQECGARTLDVDFGGEVLMTLRMLDGTQGALLTAMTELTRGQCELMVSEPVEAAF